MIPFWTHSGFLGGGRGVSKIIGQDLGLTFFDPKATYLVTGPWTTPANADASENMLGGEMLGWEGGSAGALGHLESDCVDCATLIVVNR